MTAAIILAVTVGVVAGRYLLPPGWAGQLDGTITVALSACLLGVGVSLGSSRRAMAGLREFGPRVLLVPAAIAAGSILGTTLAGLALGLSFPLAAAVGAGFGWYSLSGVILANLHSQAAGALAFLTNVIREYLAILLIPLLARRLGRLSAIAPGGATAMDVTLPVIARAAGPEAAAIAFLSGAVLSAAVPALVPLLINL